LLRDLLTKQNSRERDFRQHIRQYNFALTFTFVNYKSNTRVNSRNNRELIFFQIHDELYHLKNSLQSVAKTSLTFAQLFFYNLAKVIVMQHNRHRVLNASLLRFLTNMLHECNFFIAMYKIVSEMLRETRVANDDLRVILNSQMRLIVKTNFDRRRINLFTSDEIAVIILSEYDLSCDRDILLTKRRDELEQSFMRRINQNHAAYMSLHYVLSFSHDQRDLY
jgi:hypothetical protein